MPQAAIPWIVGLGTAASVGTQVYGAKKASDASKEAAAAQSASVDKGLALQEKMWSQGQTNLQPWLQQGAKAVNTMGDLMGLGGVSSGVPAYTPPAQTEPPKILSDLWYARDRGDRPATGRAIPRPGSEAETLYGDRFQGARTPAGTSMGDTMTMAQARSQSGYAQMQAPDGTVQSVPASMVSHYTNLGAKVLG